MPTEMFDDIFVSFRAKGIRSAKYASTDVTTAISIVIASINNTLLI